MAATPVQAPPEPYRILDDLYSRPGASCVSNTPVSVAGRISGRVVVGQRIGGGHFGDVYQGTWTGNGDDRSCVMALKHLKTNFFTQTSAIMQEVSLWIGLRHPCVLRYFGIYEDSDPATSACKLYLCSEFAAGGSLLDLIRKRSLSTRECGRVLRDVAAALQYLHGRTPPVLHNDLAARNVLLRVLYRAEGQPPQYVAVLADFGLSTLGGGSATEDIPPLPIAASPEVLEGGQYSTASDMYSFGVFIWETHNNGAAVPVQVDWSDDMLPAWTPAVARDLFRGCVARNPAERPSANFALEQLAREFGEISRELGQETATTAASQYVARQSLPVDQTSFNLPPENTVIPFVPRTELLESIMSALNRSRHVALCGNAGYGKSWLARHVVHQYALKFPMRLWFAAESVEALVADYIRLGLLVGILGEHDNSDTRLKAGIVKRWLEARRDWFAIFDNVDSNLQVDRVLELLPSGGLAVFTSRSKNHWPSYVTTIDIGLMTEKEATRMLLSSAARRDGDESVAFTVAKEYGYLPLVLGQACSFMLRRRMDLASYWRSILDPTVGETLLFDVDLIDPLHRDRWSVRRTWELSLRELEQECGRIGRQLLWFCAFLAPDSIPKRLLEYWHSHRPSSADKQVDLEACLTTAIDLSLVDYGPRGVSMHRIMQRVLRHDVMSALESSAVPAVVIEFARIGELDSLYSEIKEYDLRPHLSALNHEFSSDQAILAKLLDCQGRRLWALGSQAEALPILQHALALKEGGNLNNLAEVAHTLRYLGRAEASMGQDEEAIRHLLRAMDIELQLDPSQPQRVAWTHHDLGVAFFGAKNFAKAADHFRASVDIVSKINSHHREAGYGLRWLGMCKIELRQFEEAAATLQQGRDILLHNFEDDHYNVAVAEKDLAYANVKLAKLNDAIQLASQSVFKLERIFGDNHHNVARARQVLQEAHSALLEFINGAFSRYEQTRQFRVDNFSTSWSDGRCFCGLVVAAGGKIDWTSVHAARL